PRGAPGGLVDRLERNGHTARALTGDLDQRQRLRTLASFKEGTLPILVATDVASRGLHIPDVSHVYNWDLPQDAEDYVHRIGRTARAGAQGKAISLVDESGASSLEGVERVIGERVRVEWAEDSMFLPEIRPTAEERRRYAAEREARRAGAAVRGRGPRDHRAAGRRGPAGAAPARPAEARREPGTGTEPAGTGRPRRRRRSGRRRREGGGGPPAPAGPEAPPAGWAAGRAPGLSADRRVGDGRAAVHHERRPGDPGRLVRGEKQDGLGDVFRLADPAQRDVLAPPGQDVLPVVAGLEAALRHRRGNPARADGIDADALGRAVEGDGLGEQVAAALGRVVGRELGTPHDARHRGDVDDRAAASRLDHPEQGEAGDQEDAVQVDVDDPLPVLDRHRGDGGVA